MRKNPDWELYRRLDHRRYLGRYVVIAGGRLIGSGKSLSRLVRKAARLFPGAVPFIGRPRDPRKVYALSAGA